MGTEKLHALNGGMINTRSQPLREKILDKSKNPHYNYDKKTKVVDLDGVETEEVNRGRNHFGRPKSHILSFLNSHLETDHMM